MIPTERTRRAVARLAALAVTSAAFWGCGGGDDGFQHFPVRGTVQHDGQPLKVGTITFTPDGSGASGSGEIVDGAFSLDGADGLSPGAYRVEVYSNKTTGRKIESPDDPGAQIDETVNLVDRRFNIDSTLKADIPAGGPPGPLSFEVASPSPTSAKRKRR